MRRAPIDPPSQPLSSDAFDAFYTDALPVVFGYLVKLCGGNREQAWDLTQEVWVVVVNRLNAGVASAASVPYLITLARSKYIDAWRRERRLQRKLRLVWSAERDADPDSPSAGVVLDQLSTCSPTSRLLLMLAYVEEVPVADIAEQIGKPVSTTYSLLARARSELRDRMTGGAR
ncbi:MAG: sigma-70 family RNA polymerase sigma factor [Ilumatobacteraceae bacterium]